METKKRNAGKAAVVCTVAMLLAGETGCVGGPDLRKEPEPLACPAGSGDFMPANFPGMRPCNDRAAFLTIGNDPMADGEVEVRDGQKFTLISAWTGWPRGTVFSGQVALGGYEGQPAAFVRLTYATVPGGKKGPVCMCSIAPLNAEGKIPRQLGFTAVKVFYAGCDVQ